MTKILIVEDEPGICESLCAFLSSEGFVSTCATSVKEALEADTQSVDIALIDISLPDGNGFSVCKALKLKSDIPVIFLTASSDEFSVVAGLDMGADDYIEKPYRPHELVSRIKTVLRRYGKAPSGIISGNIRLDALKGTVTKNGKDVFLSALEYRLLLIFFNNPGVILTRARLLSELWDMGGEFVNDNTLTVYIKRLREKIENNPKEPEIITTVRGFGYRFEG